MTRLAILLHRVSRIWVGRRREVPPLNEAIKKLLPQQRRLLNLAFFREMTCEELAIDAGLQESTVKSLMSSTMSLLRKELADDA